MSLPSSLLSYTDCMDFFEKVVDDPKGGRVFMGSYTDAHTFRMRCNFARKLHREMNTRIYDEDHQMYGHSEYDPLCLQLKQDTEGSWYVYATRMQIDAAQIELLSEIDDTPPLQVEDKSNADDSVGS